MTSKYYPEPNGKSFPQLGEEVLRAWRGEGLIEKIKDRMASGEPFVFCDGPPTPNTPPRLSHALIRSVKDAFLRYHIMNGRKVVPYIAGWDCHGLPVELEVERLHGLQGRTDIEAFGIGRFNDECRKLVLSYKSDWEAMSERIGYAIDYENAYLTMSNEYIESVWWSLKQLYSKGMLGKAFGVVPYCPRCGTTLSSHEVALGYREAEGRFVVVKFRVPALDASMLAWTETPWTLVANALIAVDKEQEYALVELAGEKLVVSESRRTVVVPGAKVLSSMRGSELVGKLYEPVFAFSDFSGKGFRIVHSSEVSRDEGSGAMHLSPPYGSLDFDIGSAERLPLFDPVDDSGRFTDAVPELAGKLANDSDAEITRMLESKGALFKWANVKRSFPFCWRCYTPLIYKPGEAWAIRTSAVKQRMLELNEGIRWAPEGLKDGRFGGFLAEAKDWVISRTRFWGIPLPVWTCQEGHQLCVGSVKELREHAQSEALSEIDLHRPAVDGIRLKCPECGGEMVREPFVIDCWYDSGSAPFAQYHYPFEHIKDFEEHMSIDLVCEDADQTRGWFYTQLALSTMLFDIPAFKASIATNHVLDESGRRMTQAAGNVVYPEEVFSSVGADAARLFLLGNPVWRPMLFSHERVRKTMVRTMTTLLNVYAFFAKNANSSGFRGGVEYPRTHDTDRWIISRLNSTIKEARAGFDDLEVHRTVAAVSGFVEDLSNWYLRQSRRRFWQESDPQDRFSAQCTLHDCLLALSKLMAPITPFFADWLYRSLTGSKGSVHLEEYPVTDDDAINENLEAQFRLVDDVIQAGRLARQKVDVKLRLPLPEAVIAAGHDTAWILRKYEKMIAQELNVKRVECVESRERMIQHVVAPNLRTIGPRLKESAGEVSRLLDKIDGTELVRHLRMKGRVRLGGFDLYEEDVIVSEKERPGYSAASVGELHVYIALEASRGLKLEGLAREAIRRIQHTRKLAGLDFDDLIDVEYSAHPEIEQALSVHKARIMEETHARSLNRREDLKDGQHWTVDKMSLDLVVRRSS